MGPKKRGGRGCRGGRTGVRVVLAGTSILAALADTPAFAQLEEIVVTARKRQENIQNIPVSITAVSAEQIQNRALTSLQAVAASQPDLQIAAGNSGSGATIAIRGVGSTYTSIGIEQAVAVNVDGVYYGQGRVIHEALLDLNRVEILKGPQALFYGKNSSAGVISLTTNDPGDEFEAIGRIGYELTQQEISGEAIVSGPITDKVGLRVAFRGSKAFDGYLENAATPGTYTTIDSATFAATPHAVPAPEEDHWPGERTYLGRVTALFKPTDNLKITIKGQADSFFRLGSSGGVEVVDCPVGGVSQLSGEECRPDWRMRQNPFPADMAATNPIAAEKGGQLYQDYLSYTVTGNIQYETDSVTYTGVLNYQNLQNQWLGDYDFTDAKQVWATEDTEYYAYSFEGRALTTTDNLVNFMGGFYVQKTELDFNQDVIFFGSENSLAADPTTRYTSYRKKSQTAGKTFALFGQAIVRFLERWELTAGARFTHETKDSFFTQPYVNPLLTGLFREGHVIAADQSFDNLSPEGTLSYKPTDDVMLYVAYKQGFKSGGFSNSAIDSTLLSLDGRELSFRPEKAEGVEGGVKATLFERSLRVELTGYTYKYADLQVDFFNAATFAYVTRNAGHARQTGAELHLTYAPPKIEGLVLHAAANYNHARYQEFPNAPCYPGQTAAEGCNPPNASITFPYRDISGKPLQLAPLWTAALGFDYDHAIFGDLKWGVSFNGRYSDSYQVNPFDVPGSAQSSYFTIDGALRFGTADDRWQIAVVGKNLTEEYVRLQSAGIPLSGSNPLTPPFTRADNGGNMALPRTIQFLLTYKY